MRIAEEAARLIVDSGISDYPTAKSKACERLGYSNRADMPLYQEIEDLVRERQRLFSSDDPQEILTNLRNTALEIMRFFSEFNPRLVGDVLRGTVSRHTLIQLHVFSDDSEPVAIQLINANIQYRSIEQPAFSKRRGIIPGFSFYWADTTVEAWVYPANGLRVSPPGLVDGKPMQRASESAVRALLDSAS